MCKYLKIGFDFIYNLKYMTNKITINDFKIAAHLLEKWALVQQKKQSVFNFSAGEFASKRRIELTFCVSNYMNGF
jgi:hypothetical protein